MKKGGKLSKHDAAIRIQKWWRGHRTIVISTGSQVIFDDSPYFKK